MQKKNVGEPVNCTLQELCTFLQALGAGYLPTSCSDTNPSVPSKSISIASKSWQHGKKTGAFPGFPSLTMCRRSTDTPGEDSLTSSPVDSHAKTSQPQAEAQASTVSDPACGWKWPASSVKYDPDSCSWKTRQCSLLGGLVEFSETWPRWGSMRNGECWEQETWVHRTSESESGLWPTPMKSTAGKSEKTLKGVQGGKYQMTLDRFLAINGDGVGIPNPNWTEWLMGWPMGWTGMDALETAKSPNAPQPHLSKAAGGCNHD